MDTDARLPVSWSHWSERVAVTLVRGGAQVASAQPKVEGHAMDRFAIVVMSEPGEEHPDEVESDTRMRSVQEWTTASTCGLIRLA